MGQGGLMGSLLEFLYELRFPIRSHVAFALLVSLCSADLSPAAKDLTCRVAIVKLVESSSHQHEAFIHRLGVCAGLNGCRSAFSHSSCGFRGSGGGRKAD